MPKFVSMAKFSEVVHNMNVRRGITLTLGGEPMGVGLSHPSALTPLVMTHAFHQAFLHRLRFNVGIDILPLSDDESVFGVGMRFTDGLITDSQMTLAGLMYSRAIDDLVRRLAAAAKQDGRLASLYEKRGAEHLVDSYGLAIQMIEEYGKSYCLDRLREQMQSAAADQNVIPADEVLAAGKAQRGGRYARKANIDLFGAG